MGLPCSSLATPLTVPEPVWAKLGGKHNPSIKRTKTKPVERFLILASWARKLGLEHCFQAAVRRQSYKQKLNPDGVIHSDIRDRIAYARRGKCPQPQYATVTDAASLVLATA